MPEPAATPVQEPPAAPPAAAPAAAPADPAPAAPPWGADFDAEKAWQLVQNLRADKERLAARPALTPEQQTALAEHQRLIDAGKTEMQRHQEAAAAAQAAAAQATANAIRWKAAATHGIPAEDFDLLGTGTEEEVTARAERIAAKNQAAQAAAVTPPVTPPAGRPAAKLTPGATPPGAPSEDDEILAALGLPL